MAGIAAATHPECDNSALSVGQHSNNLAMTVDFLSATAARDIAIDNMPQGICVFNAETRLVFCNRRYAEIYRLDPEQLHPGMLLSEIVALRIDAGTSDMRRALYGYQ